MLIGGVQNLCLLPKKKKDRKEENLKYSVLEISVEVIVLSVSTLNWLPLRQSLGVRKIG